MKKYCIGIDFGGTNIKLGLVDPNGKILVRSRLATKSFQLDKNKLFEALTDTIREMLKTAGLSSKDIKGIGVGLPGLIDSPRGFIHILPNVPGWKKVPFKKILEQKIKIPVFADNDVNVITLAEWRFGAARGCKNFLGMTLGTGVGGGLVIENALYRGEGFCSGELGHMLLYGKSLETYVGNSQLLKKAQSVFNDPTITLEAVGELARVQDPKALKFWEEMGEYLGEFIVNIVNLLNPRLIVIGGGIANNYTFFAPTIKKFIQDRALKVPASMVKIVRAKLGDDAGIIGGQILVEEELRAAK